MPPKAEQGTKQRAIRLSNEVWERLEAYVRGHRLQPSKNRIVELALFEYMENHHATDEV